MALGWQIPIGHQDLPNAINRYKDTFIPYFFSHKDDFLDAGIIGMLIGRGVSHGTDYSLTVGRGDDGYLFKNMEEFDKGRPYLIQTGISKKSSGTNYKNFPCRISYKNNMPVLTIALNNLTLNSNLNIAIYNLSGKLITAHFFTDTKKDAFTMSLPVPQLSQGIYIVKIRGDNLNRYVKIVW